MSSTLTPHPDREMLLRLVDDDLSREEKQLVDGHVSGCPDCRRELAAVREALNDYLQFHQVWKASLPAAPKPWQRLDVLAGKRRVFTMTPRRWLAAAAGIAAVFLLARLLERAPEVKAAELLRKAAAAEKTALSRDRAIRIRSRKFHWDRPGRLAADRAAVPADAGEIRRLLESAGYSWEDPLSAGAYARWHDALAQKEDRVETASQTWVIHTSTEGNPISDASLTLAADYHAIACTLRFGAADTLEMSEIPEEQPAIPDGAPHAAAPPAPAGAPGIAAQPAGPADELRVIAALHTVGADLGEPVDVKRAGASVVVNLAGLDPRRQDAVKNALAGLAAVRIETAEPSPRESQQLTLRSAPQVDTANPLLEELQAVSPGGASTAELSDQLTGHTERIMERVYALRGLARRFPADVTSQLATPEVDVLNRMLRDHALEIARSAAAMERLLTPILPPVNALAVPEGGWQPAAEAMLSDVRRLDQALNAAAAGNPGARKLAVAQALRDIRQCLTRMP